MKADRVVGLIFTVGYTLALVLAVRSDASGALIDFWIWMAWLLVVMGGSLFVIDDETFLPLAGGSWTRGARYVALGFQVSLLASAGWWWTIVARLVAEGLAFRRLLLAWSRPRRGFTVDQDHLGQFFIHCYECGRNSYNRNDIDKLYCGGCNKFHHHANYQHP